MREKISEKKQGFLDRSVFSTGRMTWWTLIYVLIILFVVCTRLWGLAGRGYSHDESIHAWESWKLLTGQGYTHNPVYHGPFLYHFTALIFSLFGHNDYTGRLSPALFGIILVMLPLFLKPWLGKKGVLATMFLMAISPVMMARSRFLRHDVYVSVFNLVLFIAIFRYLAQRKTKDLYVVAAAVALGFCAKETTFITYFIFGVFLFGYLLLSWLKDRTRPWFDFAAFDLIIVIGTLILPLASPIPISLLGGDPIDYSQQGIIFSGAVTLGMLCIAIGIGLWWDWKRWLVCVGIFFGIFIPLFTTMLTNYQGVATGIVGQLGYWIAQQGIKRGGQPWYYYLVLMPMYEFLPILVGLGGTVFYAVRRIPRAKDGGEQESETRVPFVPLLIFWSAVALVLYSIAGEKMPWLMMHLVLPLQLLAGWTIGRLLGANWREIRVKGGLWLLLLIPLFVYTFAMLLGNRPFSGTTAWQLNRAMGWWVSLLVGLALVALMVKIMRKLVARDVWRLLALSMIMILATLTLRFAWMVTYINADMVTEFLVYAQGTPDVAAVTRELETMSRRLTGGLHMKVAYDDDSSWPFVWYLRDFDNAQFYGKKPGSPFDAEVVIVGPANEASVKPLLGNKYYRRQYRLIWWPNQDWYMNMTPKSLWADLRDATARKKLWDVLFYRKHEASLTAWPYVHNFAMYVRRDTAQQLWDYGPETLMAAGPLPGDEYLDKWEQRQADLTWGSLGSGPGQFRAPKGLAIDADGNIYVADSQNHRIQMLDANGHFLREWGGEGNGPGQFKEPWGIAVAPNGDIYALDTWNHRIQVYDGQGVLKRTWGIFGQVQDPNGPGNILYGPRDITFDSEGFFYVVDTGNKRVVKYDPKGRMVGATGGPSDMPFQEPVGIAVGKDGAIYVADTWNQQIQVFDKDLVFLRRWLVLAWDGTSVVNKPYLAVDQAGNVYATDPEGYRVFEYDAHGKLLRVWGQYGTDRSSMNLPTGIKIDHMGRILITDSENHRILVFGK